MSDPIDVEQLLTRVINNPVSATQFDRMIIGMGLHQGLAPVSMGFWNTRWGRQLEAFERFALTQYRLGGHAMPTAADIQRHHVIRQLTALAALAEFNPSLISSDVQLIVTIKSAATNPHHDIRQAGENALRKAGVPLESEDRNHRANTELFRITSHPETVSEADRDFLVAGLCFAFRQVSEGILGRGLEIAERGWISVTHSYPENTFTAAGLQRAEVINYLAAFAKLAELQPGLLRDADIKYIERVAGSPHDDIRTIALKVLKTAGFDQEPPQRPFKLNPMGAHPSSRQRSALTSPRR